jgi:hypothetical protein
MISSLTRFRLGLESRKHNAVTRRAQGIVNEAESAQLRVGRIIEFEVLPHYQQLYPESPVVTDKNGCKHILLNPLYAVLDGKPLSFGEYIRAVSIGQIPARDIHGPLHAARSALWAGIIAILRRELGETSVSDLISLQIASAFHDSARQDEGSDFWELESESLFLNWLKLSGDDLDCCHDHRAYSVLKDTDVLEIIRVLPTLDHFQKGRLSLFSAFPGQGSVIDQFVWEASVIIHGTEKRSCKRQLENSGAIYFHLLRHIIEVQKTKHQVPLISWLLSLLCGYLAS